LEIQWRPGNALCTAATMKSSVWPPFGTGGDTTAMACARDGMRVISAFAGNGHTWPPRAYPGGSSPVALMWSSVPGCRDSNLCRDGFFTTNSSAWTTPAGCHIEPGPVQPPSANTPRSFAARASPASALAALAEMETPRFNAFCSMFNARSLIIAAWSPRTETSAKYGPAKWFAEVYARSRSVLACFAPGADAWAA
jgi:hypothetical protein